MELGWLTFLTQCDLPSDSFTEAIVFVFFTGPNKFEKKGKWEQWLDFICNYLWRDYTPIFNTIR